MFGSPKPGPSQQWVWGKIKNSFTSPARTFSYNALRVVYIGIGLNKSIDMIQFYSNFAASAADL